MNPTRPTRRATLLAVLAALAVSVVGSPARAAEGAGFSLDDKKGEHLDVLLDGKVVARYMYAYDKSTKERLHDTYKPYLHVFDAEGKAPITKGPGGDFTHHRGIFIGWSQVGYKGKKYDRWHMKGGEIVHQRFADQKAGADAASFTSVTHWMDEAGKPFVEEERTTSVRKAPAPGRVIIDFKSTIKPVEGEVTLGGDPEHAGIHYRPAQDVVRSQTVYVFSKEGADPKKDVDYAWVGETYTLGGNRHSVVHINHPDNPKDTKYSAYRDYGRFGAFPVGTATPEKPFTVKYRFLIADGEMPAADVIQKVADDFTGASGTPVPKTTVVGTSSKGTPKSAAPKDAKDARKDKPAGAEKPAEQEK